MKRPNPALGIRDLPEGVAVVFDIEDDDFVTLMVASDDEEWIGEAQIELNEECRAWEIVDVEAVDGWGPFITDLLIEWATSQDSRLIIDRGEGLISDEAMALWKRYGQRTDVTPSSLPEGCFLQPEDYLNVAYSKKPRLLQTLGRLGLIDGA